MGMGVMPSIMIIIISNQEVANSVVIACDDAQRPGTNERPPAGDYLIG